MRLVLSQKAKFPSDFCIVGGNKETRLTQFERLTLVGGKELSRALTWLTKGLSSISVEGAIGPLHSQAVREALNFYSNRGWMDDPATYFELPKQTPATQEIPVHGLPDGEIVELHFDSRYIPQHPALVAKFAGDKSLTSCRLRLWRHHGDKRPTIIAVHGWNLPDPRLHALTMLPGMFYQEGFNVALYELPYHGRRACVSSPFPNADFIQTNDAFGQVIWELRTLRRILESSCSCSTGVIGSSLGGYCSALWAGLDELGFVVPIVPLVSLDSLAFRLLSASGQNDFTLSRRELQRLYFVHNPLSHKLKTPKDRAFLVAGRGDKVISRPHVKKLQRHWGFPPLLWALGGHAAQIDGETVFREIIAFLKAR